MKSLKLFIQILTLITLALAMGACSDKKSKSSLRDRTVRQPYDPYSPTAPSGGHSQGVIGAITQFHQDDLYDFLGVQPGMIGEVSSLPNATTGIRFTGFVDDYQQTSHIQIDIYDTYAIQGEGPITLVFSQCNSRVQGNYVTISNCQFQGDPQLRIFMEGYASVAQGFTGNISFTYANSPMQSLGRFSIGTCGFLIC